MRTISNYPANGRTYTLVIYLLISPYTLITLTPHFSTLDSCKVGHGSICHKRGWQVIQDKSMHRNFNSIPSTYCRGAEENENPKPAIVSGQWDWGILSSVMPLAERVGSSLLCSSSSLSLVTHSYGVSHPCRFGLRCMRHPDVYTTMLDLEATSRHSEQRQP